MELERTVRLSQLLDYYGGLVTPRQREALYLYCDEDFSLGEVAAYFGTSRQAVYDCLKRAAQALEQADGSLRLLAANEARRQELERALGILEVLEASMPEESRASSHLDQLRRLLEQLRDSS